MSGAGSGAGSGPPGGWRTAADIARRIQRMAQMVRGAAVASAAHGLNAAQASDLVAEIAAARANTRGKRGKGGQGADPGQGLKDQNGWENDGRDDGRDAADMAGLGWWVLAQGRLLDPVDFAAREAAREDLLEAVRKAGALVPENIWVWDETGRAQLVLATLPTLERASRVAERLRQKGLNIAVRREMPRQD